METRDLFKLAGWAALAALVADVAGYAVYVTTHSDVLLGLTMLVMIGGPAVASARFVRRVNRRAGSVPASASPATLLRASAGIALMALALGGTYAAYAVTHDRWFEGLTALALAIPTVAYQMSAASRLPPLLRHEVGQTRLLMYLFSLLPLLFAVSLASWLWAPGNPSWPVMREANVAIYFVLVWLMPALAYALRRRLAAAEPASRLD